MRGSTPQVFQWAEYSQTAPVTLTAGSSIIIPEGRIVIGVTAQDSDVSDLQFLIDIDGTDRSCDAGSAQATWAPRGANAICPAPFMIRSDGAGVSLKNAGANPIDNLVYLYIEVA